MSDNLFDLGSSVVFDAKDMQVGQHINMDGTIFVISKIEGERVFLQPVVGWSLIRYRMSQNKILVGVVLLLVLGFAIYFKGHA